MKFRESKDGVERTTIRVEFRLGREEIAGIKRVLKKRGKPSNDKAVREYIQTCSEWHPCPHLRDEMGWSHE